jgi:hypothetical protein
MPDPKKNRDGRKLIINEKLVNHLSNLLMSGNSQRTACGMAGISEATFYLWMKISEALAMGEEHPETPKPPRRRKGDTEAVFTLRQKEYEYQMDLLLHFSETIKKANLTLETGLVNTIVEAALPKYDDTGKLIKEGNWTAAMTLLERRNPQDWSRRTMGNNADGSQSHRVILEIVNEDASEND